MKLQNFLLLTGIAAGLMTVSCQSSSTDKEAEEFFGRPAPNRAKAEEQEQIDADYYLMLLLSERNLMSLSVIKVFKM